MNNGNIIDKYKEVQDLNCKECKKNLLVPSWIYCQECGDERKKNRKKLMA